MKKLLFIIFTAVILLSGCNKKESTNTTNSGPGRLSVMITDDPFNINYIESATVTITKIELRKVGEDSGNPFIVISDTPVTVDLIDLRNGIKDELVNLEIPAGQYDLVRVYVDEASLKIKDQADSYNLKVPGGEQTGIKVFISPVLLVEGGLTSELLIDFDLSRSFVMRGNMAHSAGVNGFIFKPCIRATNNTTAGRIEGLVKDTLSAPIPDAEVWVMKDTVIATAFTDPSGHYALIGIPAGTYSVFATLTDHDTAGADGVVVFPGNRTIQDFVLKNPIYFIGAVVENTSSDKVVMTYSKTLADIVPDVTAFTVNVNNINRSVSAVAIDGMGVLLTLSSPVVNGDVITVSYTKPATDPLQTGEGNQAASITPQSVTNNVAK
jgi:uncharacterized repeat protein (TIGR02059 family)